MERVHINGSELWAPVDGRRGQNTIILQCEGSIKSKCTIWMHFCSIKQKISMIVSFCQDIEQRNRINRTYQSNQGSYH